MSRPYRQIGLALGSGVARGFAHIGVLRGLEARGVQPDVITGTSIGALAGAAYAAGRLDAFEDWALSLSKRRFWRYLDLRMGGGGLIGGNRLNDLLEQHLGDLLIEELKIPFAAIAADLVSGHEIWLRDGPLPAALRASYALPGVFPPVERDGRWLVDGAIVNPVPVSVARAMEARIVIAVNLNADSFGRARVPSPAPEAEALMRAIKASAPDGGDEEMVEAAAEDMTAGRSALRWLPGRRLLARPPRPGRPARRATPGVLAVIANAFDIVQDRITRSRLAGEPPDVTIAPRLHDHGFLDFQRADEMIALGRAAVERAWPDLDAVFDALG